MIFGFMRNKRREAELDKKEAQIQAVHSDTLKKIDKYTKPTKKLNDYIEDRDITNLIFLASGGDHRRKK